VKFKAGFTEKYPRIAWQLVADPRSTLWEPVV